MRLYLSRRREGTYMLTRLRPVRAKLKGFDLEDLYFQHGDPMAIMGMCAASAKGLFGINLEPFDTIAVRLSGDTMGLAHEIAIGEEAREEMIDE